MRTYEIDPVAKPRMTRSDKWKQRPAVMKYRSFADEVRRQEIKVRECGSRITFVVPMPKSWSKKKKLEHLGRPHQTVPDIDNFLKALLDAIYESDAHIWDIHPRKIWGEIGMITVEDERYIKRRPIINPIS